MYTKTAFNGRFETILLEMLKRRVHKDVLRVIWESFCLERGEEHEGVWPSAAMIKSSMPQSGLPWDGEGCSLLQSFSNSRFSPGQGSGVSKIVVRVVIVANMH